MLFLINNPLLLLIAIVIVGFMIHIGRKIATEIELNKLLNLKHRAMRIKKLNPGFTRRIGVLLAGALSPVFVVVLILTIGTTNSISPTGELLTIRNSRDVVETYDTFQRRLSSSYDIDFFPIFNTTKEENTDTGAEYVADLSDSGSDDYSETNNQVFGVDEMDNVVTDGKYLYTIHNNKVEITLAYTEGLEAEALDHYMTIEYVQNESNCPTGFYLTGLFVDADYLVVVGSNYSYTCNPDSDFVDEYYYQNWEGYNDNVSVYVYDKNDDYSLESEYSLTGNLIGTRKIDDNLYIITNNGIPFYSSDLDVDEYLPSYEVNSTIIDAQYEDVIYIDGTAPNSFITFYALDLDNEQVDMEVVLGDSRHNLYVSTENIYLVGNIYYFEPLVDMVDVAEPVSEVKTAIMKVEITDAHIEYSTTGQVPGYMLNQFSMDENDGYLRVATTTGNWGNTINNRIIVLDENLDEVSRLENLGEVGETIKSARFVDDFVYLVTFKETDPFYVIDLSDNTNPEVLGELKIDGFSTYLQPLSDDYMLGIGYGDSSGGTNGLKISVYDISDKTNPQVFSEVTFDYDQFGWNYSSATYNHKDLLVSLRKGLIALPFNTYEYTDGNYVYNSGILVYHFDEENGLVQSGFVRHEENSIEDVYVYKSKFISEYFYTISNKFIKVSTIENPEIIINSILFDNE